MGRSSTRAGWSGEGVALEPVGYWGPFGRDLFVLDVRTAGDVPESLSLLALPSPYFVCLIAWDAREAGEEEIRGLVDRLLRGGCVYFVCWGPDCSRVDLLADLVELDLRPDGPWAMTTCHEEEALAEAIWFFLHCAYPDEAFSEDCHAGVVIAIGRPDWAAEAREALSDPERFSARLLGEEGDPSNG